MLVINVIDITVTSLHTSRVLCRNQGSVTAWTLSAYLIVAHALVSVPRGPLKEKKKANLVVAW